MQIEYEPRLVEEAVRVAVGRLPEARLFHREREAAYRVRDAEERGRAFDALHLAWFERLRLDRPLQLAFAEQPLVRDGVSRCGIGCATRRQDAGAELLVREPGPGQPPSAARRLRLLIPIEMVADAEALLPMIRRELQHVADMLDPRFGYRPRLGGAAGPAHERLLRERYRVVWDTSVDGRLTAMGRLPAASRAARREEFGLAFGALGADVEEAFARFFDDPAPTHAGFAAFVTASALARTTRGACALCGFPTTELEPADALPDSARAEIVHDFPAWRPEDGCCRQCAELYRTAAISAEAAAALPGIR